MVRQYQGVLVLAYHTGDTLGGDQGGGVEDDINVTIVSSVSCEVMVSFVVDMDLFEGDISNKVIKKGDSLLILAIDITISPDKQNDIRINFSEFINTDLQFC